MFPAPRFPARRSSLALAAAAMIAAAGFFAPRAAEAAQAKDLALAPVFGDSMVLQQGRASLFGKANPGAMVEITFRGRQTTAKAGADGSWRADLKTGHPGGPFNLAVKSQAKTLRLREVLVGEVWLCAGQSNMDLSLAQTPPNGDSAAQAQYPHIRLMDFRGDRIWRTCNPDSVQAFSATGYYFGRELWRSQKVPIGLIESAKGGTPIERWMNRESQRRDPLIREDSVIGDLYRAHIAPMEGMGMRGLIWYQGESNTANHPHYGPRFAALIRGWREAWKRDFPFFFVQLANYGKPQSDPNEDGGWPRVREAQRQALALPHTAMAVAIDVNPENDPHPPNKCEVGRRLSLPARALVYGEKVVYSGPVFRGLRAEGQSLRLYFRHAGQGLRTDGGPPRGFALAGEDGIYHWAQAEIQGKSVLVHSPEVEKPVSVRYGWGDNPSVNLKNSVGLPAIPFQANAANFSKTNHL